ncbi:MAG: hypothetical protein ABFD89_00840 [Bryobacteraceae bacterium]
MAISFAETNLVCLSAFGETVTYTPASGTAASISGIVDRSTDSEQELGSPYLRLFIAVADLAATPALGDGVTIGAVNYVVVKVSLDSGGGAWLLLKVSA